ncbi:MAG: guanylate kinase [Paludibacteraceae bacterium]
MQGKLIIFSAPSGAGKSTIVNYLLTRGLNMEFSISATSREPRGNERHGYEYYFISKDEFKERIAKDEFIEYEEVYPNCFYGTLRSEVERITSSGNNVVFDVDVKGGLNIKKQFGELALAVFIAPPSIETLRMRLLNRCTDSTDMIEKRVGKAAYEMTFAPQFDVIILNDDLQQAEQKAEMIIRKWLNS